MKTEETALTLNELSTQVGQLLSRYSLLGVQADHRVSVVPDARTIRYYTTLGLIDRPRIDGRQAKYGRRHVLQVLAIKPLQAINLPLSQIQTRLYGRSDQELEAVLASMKDYWNGKRPNCKRNPSDLNDPNNTNHLTIPNNVNRHLHHILPITWREITIEPGVKLLVQDGWQPEQDKRATLQKISALLEIILRGSNLS